MFFFEVIPGVLGRSVNFNIKISIKTARVSRLSVSYDYVVTDNLQNLRFYQLSSKNMNANMFCTKSKLLTPKTVLKVSLFQIFY